MNKIVECVPNFSEGRNRETIELIARAIRKTPGCRLLDVDSGQSTNRTVYTFVGDPDAVVNGALNAAFVARDHIDMRKHTGEHPRMGALDVCPFIPVANVNMEECVALAEKFGRRLSEALKIPVYLYEHAAKKDFRRKLPDIRQGEYEALPQRLKDPKWEPDFGRTDFVPEWGATATGARTFLIAYNVNIMGTPNQAHRIALNLREAGRGPEEPGRLEMIKGMGWFVDEYNMAQVTLNISDYTVTPVHVVFEEVKKEARALNVGVAGSEIVGLVPLASMLMAADYYIEKESLFIMDEDQKIRLVVDRLGLNSVSGFNPREKIIEYLVEEPREEPLAGMPVRAFIESLAARSSAPGGGSASALAAAMGVGLGMMVANLTYGVRRFEDRDSHMRRILPLLNEITQQLIPMIDADTAAYNRYMQAVRMPKDTTEQKVARSEKIKEGLRLAVLAPLETMRLGDKAWDAMCDAAQYGNPALASDIQVGARMLQSGIWGAFQNVMINLEDIDDDHFCQKVHWEAEAIVARAEQKCKNVLELSEGK
jgi:glutamate formiminotransferase/formiminotetrahydrofolate cyclodeaminase